MRRIDKFALVEVFSKIEKQMHGNTSVVIMAEDKWTEKEMQQMASDWNQPATTFLFPTDNPRVFNVRWFAPDAEIGLCGHGSLAAFAYLYLLSEIIGTTTLRYADREITGQGNDTSSAQMTLKAIPHQSAQPAPDLLSEALGKEVKEYYPTANKHLVVLNSEEDVRYMKPDFARLREIDVFGYSVTAPGREVDFVSRTLVPHVQQLEDHATGSSHAALAPFWSERLEKQELSAYQLSPRGGAFNCSLEGDQVNLAGNYRVMATGQLT